MAFDADVFRLWPFLAALFGSIMIQIGTNFANDLFDFKKQVDTTERIGPTRVTQAGMVTQGQIMVATIVTFALAMLAGIYLVYVGGWPIVIIGLASIAFGVLYTAGPVALGYIGIADVFVLVFFGPVALAGTYFVQAIDAPWPVILAGVPFGMISTAILTVNNLRDIDTDKKTGKRSLAVRFGRTFAKFEYTIMMLGAAVIAVAMAFALDRLGLLLCVIFVLAAIPALRVVITDASTEHTSERGERLNKTLATTGRLLIMYGVLFSVGWLWHS